MTMSLKVSASRLVRQPQQEQEQEQEQEEEEEEEEEGDRHAGTPASETGMTSEPPGRQS